MEVILCMNTDLTPDEATLLYLGLTTDTGCFQYSNTSAASFRAAAELLRLGADNAMVSTVFFRKVSRARLKLESMIYSGLQYFRDGKIAVATITLEMMEKAGATEDDCDDLAGLAGRVEGSILNITIREQEDGYLARTVLLFADSDIKDTALNAPGKPCKIVAVVLGRTGLFHHFQGDSRNGYLSVPEKLQPGVYHALEL